MLAALLAVPDDENVYIKAAAAWSVGQVGQHSSEHAKAVAMVGVLPSLLECMKTSNNDDLVQKVFARSLT